jgi:hypothetical protein
MNCNYKRNSEFYRIKTMCYTMTIYLQFCSRNYLTLGIHIKSVLNQQVYNCTHKPPNKICFDPNDSQEIHIEPIFEMLAMNSSFAFKIKAHVTENSKYVTNNFDATSSITFIQFRNMILLHFLKSPYRDGLNKNDIGKCWRRNDCNSCHYHCT